MWSGFPSEEFKLVVDGTTPGDDYSERDLEPPVRIVL